MLAVEFLWYNVEASLYPWLFIGMVIGIITLGEIWNWLRPITLTRIEKIPEEIVIEDLSLDEKEEEVLV